MKTMLPAGVWAVAVLLVASAPVPAVEKEDVDKAVQRGVQALRGGSGGGQWSVPVPGMGMGMTALAALTLLECEVAPDDPALKQAIQSVRAAAVKETKTYCLALAILFLDRLGDPVDGALIEALTIRLMAGQLPDGGWSYDCPPSSDDDQARLSKQVKEASELKGRRELPKPDEGKGDEAKAPDREKTVAVLKQVQELFRNHPAPNATADNSNTQFATLGLWVARRQGLPVEGALARVDRRFRSTQNRDGGWSYTGQESIATMTGAGSLCLAITDATVNALSRVKDSRVVPRDIKKDTHLVMGMKVLGALIDHPAATRKARGLPAPIPQVGGTTFYFLWTLERTCVALDLETLGGKDWYNWGAEILLANQQADGSWKGDYSSADTCFALLFLRRANLAKDLTANLKGKLGDPGETTLKSGGVGSSGLKGIGLKPALEEKKDPKNPSPGATPKALDDKTEQGKIAKEIVESSGAKQEKLIEKYRDEKGVKYTEALTAAIPHLTGEAKSSARDALAQRLARMKADTLTNYLKDEEAEIRRAAALACALKESKAHIPQLIEMLRKEEPLVERAVVAALKDLTGQNFGPSATATAAERDKAITAWQDWLKKQQK